MSPEKTEILIANHPKLYSKFNYFECDDGWFTIIYSTSSVIESTINSLPIKKQSKIYADQIKEKFGLLRWYMSTEVERIRGAIELAEELSGYFCENCGAPGTRRNINRWLITLCDSHFKDIDIK